MLTDKVAIVTGGSTGIGRAFAAEYVDQGAEVVICGRTESTGNETAEAIGCEFRQCDVREFDDVEALVEGVVSDYGRLDVIVNNRASAARRVSTT